MEKMQELEQAAREAMEGQGFDDMGTILESELALLSHSLIHGTDQLGDWEIRGLSYLVNDIRCQVSVALKFCQQAQEYFSYLNDPKALAEDAEIEKVVAGVDG